MAAGARSHLHEKYHLCGDARSEGLKHNPLHLVTLAGRLAPHGDTRLIAISEGLGADFLKEQKKLLDLPSLRIMAYQPLDLLAAPIFCWSC